MSKTLVATVDGSTTDGNPGNLVTGVIIHEPSTGSLLHTSTNDHDTRGTNNEAEYLAVLQAVQTAWSLGATTLTVWSDSQLVVRQLRGMYKVRQGHLKLLHTRVHDACTHLEHVLFRWHRRDDGWAPVADAASKHTPAEELAVMWQAVWDSKVEQT